MTKGKKYPPINVTCFENKETGKEFYTPESDIIFKCIFGSPGNEAITKSFLESILGYEIEEFTLDANPYFMKNHVNAKQMIADIKAICCKSKNKFLIEMQTTAYRHLTKRFTVYSHNSHNEDLKKSDNYNLLKKIVTVALISKNLPQYKKIENYHTIWSAREKEYSEYEFDEDVTIHVIELQKYIKNKKKTNEVNYWLEFIIDPLGEEVKKAMEKSKELRLAVDLLHYLNSIDSVRELAFAERLAQIDRNSEITCAKEEAREIGYEQGIEKGMTEGRKEGIKEGREEGIKEGREEGREQGRQEGITKIATKMLKSGCDIQYIMEITGLTKEQIEQLTA